MNENIDLTKILKDCPKGTKLHSTIFGEVKFIEYNLLYQIVVAKENKYYYFTSKGEYIFKRINYTLEKCALFPSKDQRDWSKFTAPWYKKERFDPKTLKPFDRVISRNKYDEWTCTLFSHIGNKPNTRFIYVTCESVYKYCIPYNDDTKHLLGTKEEAPEYYRYWED